MSVALAVFTKDRLDVRFSVGTSVGFTLGDRVRLTEGAVVGDSARPVAPVTA